MNLLFIFLDGIGLGEENSDINPLARAKMPRLREALGGKSLTRHAAPYEGENITTLSLDAGLGMKGLPQSATGQAVLLTGINIPAEIGYHYGPKPNPEVAKYLSNGTLFSKMKENGKRAALLNAYPPRYFQGIDSGKRLYSAIPLAVTNAEFSLFTKDDFFAGKALSADFTGRGWRSMLGFSDAPIMEPKQAGYKLAELARQYDFSLFEYWASDYAGHKQNMDAAVELMETFDGVLDGALESWKDEDGLILVTSDHGNMEDVSTRKHTNAHVPALLFGNRDARRKFAEGLNDLTGIAPRIEETVFA